MTLDELIKQKQATSYIFCQKGNRLYPEEGSLTRYGSFDAKNFGNFEMHKSKGISWDGIEYTYESDWITLKPGLKVKVKI